MDDRPDEADHQIRRHAQAYWLRLSNCPMTQRMLNESSPGFSLNDNGRFRINGATFS